MLKGIPKILSPELLKVLCEMGHSDEIIIADGNFPAESMNKRVIRMDGHNVPEVLSAVLTLFPLDTYADPVHIMAKVKGDSAETPIWDTYNEIVSQHTDAQIKQIERFSFYERTKAAYAVIATSESALYANIMLKKGVIVN